MSKNRKWKYCPTCGKKLKNSFFYKFFSVIWKIIITTLSVFGILGISVFIFMIFNIDVLDVMINRIRSNSMAEISHEYNGDVLIISNNISKRCENITCSTEDYYKENSTCEYTWIEDCKITETRKFMVNNFEWENDWVYGSYDETHNLLKDNKTKGDCEDWSVTTCNILHHMGISCRPVIYRTGPSNSHVIVLAKDRYNWIFFEPQSKNGYWNPNDDFGGHIV